MIVYRSTHATGYELITGKGYDENHLFAQFDGTSRKEGWKPVAMCRDRVNMRQAFKPTDLAFWVDTLVIRRSGLEALRDVFEAHGEILPLATDDGVELWVCNVLGVLDAHDLEHSNIEPIEGTRAHAFYKEAFLPAVIGDAEMFRTSIDPSRVYFTDRFVERVKKLKLKGTAFVPLWSSEGPLPKAKSK